MNKMEKIILDVVLEEAADRVWYDRSDIGTNQEKPGTPEEIRQKALAQQERIVRVYGIDPAECDDFYHGYWSGILAMARLMAASDFFDIEDLRDGTNGILDT